MSKESSFDVVSEFDRQELVNAVDQARRDVKTRYDLKDSKTEIELGDKALTVTTDDDMKLRAVIDILQDKLTKRGLSPLLLDTSSKEPESALGGQVRQELPLRAGIDKEMAKKVVAEIKALKLKVQASIQGEQVRVSAKSRDDLQTVIQTLREKEGDWQLPLQFENYR